MRFLRLDELRFPQEFSQASAVAGTSIDTTGFVVPAGILRTLLYVSYGVDVGEARYITLKVIGAAGVTHSIIGPVAHDSNNGNPFALLERMTVELIPGDRLRVDRSSATAGSICTLYVRYVDSIIPYQRQYEPQVAKISRSPFLRRIVGPPGSGGGGAPGPGGRGGEPPTGGGGGAPEPY